MKRPALVAGAALLLIGAGAAAVWLKQPQWIDVVRARLAPDATQAATATTPAAAISVPEPMPPPEPTNADFARAGAIETPAAPATTTRDAASIDWAALPIDDLRSRANADEVVAMEELARRLVHGVGIPKDQQAGAGWLLRAAQHGSGQSAFNVGVMYERGFVVERDSTKAIEWYRKAVAANVPMAKHNLALLLRDGKGAPRNTKEAVELLRSAARQGMAASMFTLGDIYERGDDGLKDPAIALAWFGITAEFERQTNRNDESALGKMASQRAQVLQRTLLAGDLERAQQLGQTEFKQIVEALQPPKPAPSQPAEAATAESTAANEPEPPGWPLDATDQVRAIQQALADLKILRDKPDGTLGPMTRNAIRAFQRSIGIPETGEPSRDVFAALQDARAKREATNAATTSVAPAKADATEPAAANSGDVDTWPTSAGDQIRAIQALLRDLNFSRDAPDGLLGPGTRSAIREYQRSLGVQQTGEPTRALFDSLREMRALTSKAN